MDIIKFLFKILTSLGLIGLTGFIIKWIINLKVENGVKDRRIIKIEDENSKLITDNKKIYDELLKFKSLEDLMFDDKLGIYKSSTDNYFYCPKCVRNKDRTPMKASKSGWYCAICNHSYSNPDYKIPMGNGHHSAMSI